MISQKTAFYAYLNINSGQIDAYEESLILQLTELDSKISKQKQLFDRATEAIYARLLKRRKENAKYKKV